MKELEQIKAFPITSAGIGLFAERLIEALENGDINPIELMSQIKAIAKVSEAIKPTLDRLAQAELAKHPKETAEINGVKHTIRQGNVKHDFASTGDFVWRDLKEYVDEYNKLLKEREDLLKTIKGKMEIVDQSSGEVLEVLEPVKTYNLPSIVTSFS